MARTRGSKNRITASTDFDAQIAKLQKDKAMLEEGLSKTVAQIEELKTDIKSLRESLKPQKAEIKQLPQLEGLRALVADDDTNTCLSVSTMLSKIGMRPEWTISGKEAVIRTKYAVEQGDAFSVYIIDWLIPDMNGIEIVRQIRKVIGDSCPIIILTAYDWADIEEEARLLRKAAVPRGAAQGTDRALPGAVDPDARPAAQGKL